jgi:nitrite reductase/ring-hydroxylating ferredoxin subunit
MELDWLPKAKEWYFACKTQDVPDGGVRRVHVYDQEVLLTNLGGEFYGMEPWCPHNLAPLEFGDLNPSTCVVICPEHAMEIDVRTGENVCGPYGSPGGKFEPNWTFPTKVENGRVYVRVKTDEEIEEYYRGLKVPFKLMEEGS